MNTLFILWSLTCYPNPRWCENTCAENTDNGIKMLTNGKESWDGTLHVKDESVFWKFTPRSIQFKILSFTVALQDGLWKSMAVLCDIIPSESLGMCAQLPHNDRVSPGCLLCSISTESVCPEGFRTSPGIRNAVKEGTRDFINASTYFIKWNK